MKITQVEYRRLVTYGHFENQTIGAVADVEPGEEPEDALAKLEQFVADQHAKKIVLAEAKEDASREIAACHANVKQMQEEMDGWRQRWVRARQFLEQHGIPTGKFEDVPF